MINPTGSQLQHLFQWCLWQKKTLGHISVAAQFVRPQLWQLLSIAKKLLFLTALKAGAVCGLDIPSLWYLISSVTFCVALGFKFESQILGICGLEPATPKPCIILGNQGTTKLVSRKQKRRNKISVNCRENCLLSEQHLESFMYKMVLWSRPRGQLWIST